MNSTPSSNETPEPTVWPVLLYEDAPAAIDFLVRAFGFVEVARFPGEAEGEISRAELAWPAGGGVMVSSALDSNKEFPPSLVGTAAPYVVTDDPDAVYAGATAAGAEVLRPVEDVGYGYLSCTLRDPEGTRWSFGTYRGQPRPASS
ncbi:putative glyoxalase superfamily protein PhnB [Lipingzhangella halophila]|uniref:Putative glyoxalase superfamily protein PhnB n=1 Tax=Lipingzhangella halophila TaxID=1783352 RepID=A0A7W7RNR3_9ACTN|nr:VOC family protein [Lipingzhangella halophila]MBB4935365.1 putative glyoxalase superfamily protein PhnB [Lipingzhangella halophila]